MKNIFIIFSFFLATTLNAQDLSNYNHVVIPEKYSFLKETDQYQLNSLTKFLFEKYGFEAFIEGDEEYVKMNPERCEGLYADVISDSGMFRTKLSVVLKDCRNREIFISREGVSLEKDYKAAYQESLRRAFESIEALEYSYNEVIVTGTPGLNVQAEAKANQVSLSSSAEVKEEKSTIKTATEVQNTGLPQNKISPKEEMPSSINLHRDGSNYLLQKNDKGFLLLHKGTTEPFATLIRSSAGNSFIYNSMTSKGIACLDIEGNLIIEILKEDGESLETIVYRVEDQ